MMRLRAYRTLGCWLRCLAGPVALAALSAFDSVAAPVNEQRVRKAVAGWLRADAQPLHARMGARIAGVTAYPDADGTAAYYVVELAPEGYVILPADDEVEPFIAFSSQGRYDPSVENPLFALVSQDVPGRVRLVRRAGRSAALNSAADAARAKWQRLELLEQESAVGTLGLTGVSDVRVAPLIASRWSQTTVSGLACYNYFTPPYAAGTAGNYPCGCVATAVAQLMRYFSHPSTGVGAASYTITVDGVSRLEPLRGGDGAGGAYVWTNMVLVPGSSITLAQRQAIGALTHDVGCLLNMDYSAGGATADTLYSKNALTSVFGYANAIKGYNAGADLGSGLNAMVNPNLDAGFPVLLGLTGTSGHAVVCDGYGYNLSTLYHHLNLGWAGSSDAWYALPTVDTGSTTYTSVYKCVYNVFTAGTGELVSGRVLNGTGNPLAGAVVTALRTGGGTYSATTDVNGIYALKYLPSSSKYTLTAAKAGYAFSGSIVVNVGLSADYGKTAGNAWDKTFQSTTSVAIPDVQATGVSNVTAYSAWLSGQLVSTGGASTTVRMYWGAANGGTNPASWGAISNLGVRAQGSFGLTANNLTPGASYWYRCSASNSAGVAWATASVAFATAPAAADVLALSASVLSNATCVGSNAVSQSFEVWNSGSTNAMGYSLAAPVAWVALTPSNGVSAGEHDTIAVAYMTAGLAAGTYATTVTVNSVSATNAPRSLRIVLTVTNLLSATHVGDGYASPGVCAITSRFNYPANRMLLSLLVRPDLPEGWTLGTLQGNGNPQVTNGSDIVFTGVLTNNPIELTYQINVPSGITGTQSVAATAEYQLNGMINPSAVQTAPDPLLLRKLLTLPGLAVSNKVYDGTGVASVAAYGGLAGVTTGDVVSLVTTGAVAAFSSAQCGTGKTVTVTGLSLAGADAYRYAIAPQTAAANITPKSVSLSGLSAANKVYDGTTNAVITDYGTLTGIVGTDAVTLVTTGASAAFATSQAGTGRTVTVTGLSLSGAAQANYTIGAQATVANITRATPAVTAWPVASGIVYGQALSSSVLTGGTASVAGTFAFGDPAALPTAGVWHAAVTFAPSDLANYNAVGGAVDVTVSKAGQTIVFPNPGNQLTTNVVNLTASASSGLPVALEIVSGPALLAGTTLSFTAAGTVKVAATQAGDSNWQPAAAVTNTLTVSKAAAAMTLSDLDQTYNGTARAVNVTTAPTGLTVSVSYNGSMTAPTQAGSYVVTGVVNSYLYQGTITGMLVVRKAGQALAFPSPGDQLTTNTLALSATATSGLTVEFEVVSGPAQLAGASLSFTNAGTVVVVARQPGDANWDPAVPLTNTFAVAKIPAGIALSGLNQAYAGTMRTVTAVTTPAGLGINVTYDGSTTPPTAAGSYAVTGSIDDVNYQASAAGTLVVERLPLVLSNMAAADKVYDGSTVATIVAYGILSGVVEGDDVTLDVSNASATFETAQIGQAKSVIVTGLALDGADSANYSIDAQVTTAAITPPEVQATQGSSGYASPSTNMVVTNTFEYPAERSLTYMTWTPILPAGWTLAAAAGDANPTLDGSSIVFYGPATNHPVAFTYTVNVPAGQGLSNALAAVATYWLDNMTGEGVTVTVVPDVLSVCRRHTADYREPYWVIDGTEVNRVLVYWRAGGYHLEPFGYDGYAPGTGATDGARHTADYQSGYWDIDEVEAQRALAYWRAGSYHVYPASTTDGYLPGAGEAGSGTGEGLAETNESHVTIQGPNGYDPSGVVVITNTLEFSGQLLSLSVRPQLPSGWELVSAEAEGAPEVQRGAILWTGTQPQSPIHLTYTVRVPLWERATREIRSRVSYYLAGMLDIASVTSPAGAVILPPRDADADGLPDGWEAYYSTNGMAMAPDADDDGDHMANWQESVAGTDPTDALSLLKATEPLVQAESKVVLQWHCAVGRWYTVERSIGVFDAFHPVATNLPATWPVNTFEDSIVGQEALFYRIVVEP